MRSRRPCSGRRSSPRVAEVEILVSADPAGEAAARLAAAARGGGHVVLTGGRTPARAYEHAAELEPDWSRVELWWGDERCVPPDDTRSNYALARSTLLERVKLGPVHRIHGEAGRERGASLYE